METTKILIGYAIYLPVALFLTYYVSRTLFKNSKVYMLDIFKGREEIANATKKLFETAMLVLKEIISLYSNSIEVLTYTSTSCLTIFSSTTRFEEAFGKIDSKTLVSMTIFILF
jgi:hypothetical protein